MAAIPRCTIWNRGVQMHRFWCLPSASLPCKFQDFPGPCTQISTTFQDQTHFPGLAMSMKFYKHNSRTSWDLALRFPRFSRTKLIFRDVPGPGNFPNILPGFSKWTLQTRSLLWLFWKIRASVAFSLSAACPALCEDTRRPCAETPCCTLCTVPGHPCQSPTSAGRFAALTSTPAHRQIH